MFCFDTQAYVSFHPGNEFCLEQGRGNQYEVVLGFSEASSERS